MSEGQPALTPEEIREIVEDAKGWDDGTWAGIDALHRFQRAIRPEYVADLLDALAREREAKERLEEALREYAAKPGGLLRIITAKDRAEGRVRVLEEALKRARAFACAGGPMTRAERDELSDRISEVLVGLPE